MIPLYNIEDFFSVPLKVAGFHINTLENMPPLPANIESLHKHNFVEIFFILKGETQHNVDFEEYTIFENDLFFISKGQLHIWAKNMRTGIKGYRLMFAETFLDNYFIKNILLFELLYSNNIYKVPRLSLCSTRCEVLLSHFSLLLKEYEHPETNINALLANLYLVLLEIQRTAEKNLSISFQSYGLLQFQRFSGLVEAHYRHKWNNQAYADALHISLSQLNRLVVQYAQLPVGRFVQQRTVLEAKRLLLATSLSITEIAYELGFEDPSYFVRLFRRETHLTPLDFRRKMQA